MSIEFNEGYKGNTIHNTKPKGITGFIIKIGFAKNVKQANFIMFVIIGIMAVIFFISIDSLDTNDKDTYNTPLDELESLGDY